MKISEILKKYGIIIFGIVCIACYIAIPYLLTRDFNLISYQNTGQIGDTIGGILGPFFGIIGILLTFYAFLKQNTINSEQKEQFKKQDEDLKIERFESKYFELIKIYRENVNEIDIEGIKGRKAFISMFYEFKLCYEIVSKTIDKTEHLLTEKDKVNISFILFYSGIEIDFKPIINTLLKKYNENNNELIDKIIIEMKQYMLNNKPDSTIGYSLFKGHLSFLGHYFRHLWFTVNFLDKNKNISDDSKNIYIKILRSQISNYEQLLLYYNSITELGKVWIDTKLLIKYKIVKNMPIPLATFGPEISQIIEDSNFFEWEEINNIKK